MGTQLRLEKHTAILFAGALAIATCSQPSWGHTSIERVDPTHQNIIQLLKGYEPPDNGSPERTGDTGGR
ncbi:hypothetical protein [Roseofilum capinflatum]|uniref:Uncharacterized protein n=1 Tax=Roseofilum capinflatum BLCC-M114 TaxID=3022440 RepID=A0ABT7B6X7_9CYAN|nr:hypothetical protein [Roseofilum capinflatum]MDJ1174917.1 hypothetical protein [Roseofilum capinflatum BLCC-M114]